MARPISLLILLLLLWSAPLARTTPASGNGQPVARAVEAIGLTVSDIDRAVAFFSEVLSFEKLDEVEVHGDEYERLQGIFGLRMRVARMRLGSETIELTEYLTTPGRPIPVDSRSHDRWFQHIAIIVRDMDEAYAWLRRHRVTHASPGPQRLPDWNPTAGGICAFYFKDPDGHALEVLQFPSGKGDPRWHDPTDRLFLGIDHTAIVVGDTEASLGFYGDLLGLRVAGESENHGPAQERLNNVFGARLRITTMKAPAGPGIEFLEYLTPGDGRQAVPDVRPNDIAHWQTTIATGAVQNAYRKLRAARAGFISPGPVALTEPVFGFREGMLVRDPDGHAVRVVGSSR